jgi:two-component system, NarL family, sensor histidine kinase DegS
MAHDAMTPREELLSEFEVEYDKIKKRMTESQQLIEQTQLEVNRLRDRNVAISAQLSRVETNFDTIPRADLKSAYEGALDAKTRLLTMQGQLEKAKGTQEELQHFEKLLGRFLDHVRGLGADQLPTPSSRRIRSDMLAEEGGGLSTKAIISIVESQEVERQRLARQMHDGPAQSLTNFILQAEICQRLFDRNPDRAGEELNNLKTAASSTFQKVRDFIFDLRPMMLDDLGLIPTIRRYVEAYEEKTNIETQLNILGDERRLPGHIEVMMFRSVQSIMGSARDKLGAKFVNIVLDVGPEWLKATIEHDGRSFDPDAVLSEERHEDTYGLRTLKERIELVGGSFEVTSAEEELSRYVILLPAMG